MRLLRTYPRLDPVDWTATNLRTVAENHIVVASDGHAWAVILNPNGWMFHNAAGPQCVSGLDLWTALRFLNDRQCRVIA